MTGGDCPDRLVDVPVVAVPDRGGADARSRRDARA
ncbi:hypothetical protein Ae168Ps1_5492c [Pseudonocardia sp. Ae168_Ps1]|nr:hypothetical protein Ae168Ps1_5492c [Pseudonocardia sp. Ae168_Ps1]OLL77460.1 hypothetical protein Ae150APs1_5838 [Pseudonocardia sp. Ae150A_Ps1]OLL88427.1 hypothetical protein Ae263Ps1_5482c [Pseudonocardia sp. Ae263_Ps1]OLL91550.1 hypothetical protein Ae356Ps1_1447 [Pseudonocardia sp. Ae356_Ps1]